MSFKIIILACCIGLLPLPACAYIDPGTGSVFFQVFAAAVIGGFFAFKSKVKALLGRIAGIFSKKPDETGK